MSKKYYKMNPAELLVFLTNFIAVADDKQTELGLTTADITLLQGFKSKLETKINNRQSTKETATSAKTELDETQKEVNDLIGSHNNGFKSDKTIPDSLIELLGLDADSNNLTPIVPVAPTDLVVMGSSNGVNSLKWKSGGNKPRTTYIVEAKIGAATEYVFVKATSKTRFEHKNQTPGVKVLYRVKAVHGDLESDFSNEAVVYN
ncbi:MAG TPA: fibronectin type III domain-containing protein [Pyrinomonadaceae bacterium]|nr:fibronectin type III domain-containing protein [Pyrinomonadaceae bacterium]